MSLEDRIRLLLQARAARVQARSDGWQDLERRLDLDVPGDPEPDRAGHALRRVATAALAFAVFAAAGIFVWNAFKSGPVQIAPTTTATYPIAATYPSPPTSGYWIVFPEHVTAPPVGTPDIGLGDVRLVALTNLPDGTLYTLDTQHGFPNCCWPVADGRIDVSANDQSCYGLVGDIGHDPGFSAKVTVSTDVTSFDLGDGIGASPPPDHQPDSVLRVFGNHFQRLTGSQVVKKNGVKTLVASKSYAWPKHVCGSGPFPLFGGPTCAPAQSEVPLQDRTVGGAMGEIVGEISQAAMCPFWSVDLQPDVEAHHPWPAFAAEWRHWFLHPPKDFSNHPIGTHGDTGSLGWHVTSRQGEHFVVDVTNHGRVIITIQIEVIPHPCQGCDPHDRFWAVESWTLH